MPIIRPEIQKVLRASGLMKEQTEGTINEKLDQAGLTDDRIAESLTELATGSSNDALRLRALETALKVKGALKEQAPPQASFNIVIQSSSGEQIVNPILMPHRPGFGSNADFKDTDDKKIN